MEKIWILYGIEQEEMLHFNDYKSYLKQMTYPQLKDEEIIAIYKDIDRDGNNHIDKQEMFEFLKKLLIAQRGIQFKKFQHYKKKEDSCTKTKVTKNMLESPAD